MKEFLDRVAVVTGGASGVGRALGAALLREGARVVLADVEQKALDRTVEELGAGGAPVLGVRTDVTVQESVVALEARAREVHGAVHLLFNNAGVGAHEDLPLWELPLADWRWTFAVNVYGVIHGIRAFVPNMLAQGGEGHVVNTSSGNGGLVLVPSTPVYSASKAAVSSITETLHLQLVMQQAQLRAHVLYPGPHLVTSNIFDAARNRSAEFARDVPHTGPPVTLEVLRSLAEASGRSFETTTPEEVAESALEGLRRDAFYILPWTEEGEARFRERCEGVLQRRDPAPTF